MSKGDHPKASKSNLKADRPDRLNYFNCMNDSGKIVSCCAVMDRKLLTSPGIADTYTCLMNTCNTLLESYQQREYNNTLATVKCRIKHAENPTPAMVISVQAARVDIAILLDYLTSDTALEEPEIGSTDPNIPIDINCIDDKLHFGMPGGSGDFGDEGDERDAIPTSSRQRQAATALERFDLGTSDVLRYQSEDGDGADAPEEEEASQGDDGSTQNVED
jgi:hypothetical protein